LDALVLPAPGMTPRPAGMAAVWTARVFQTDTDALIAIAGYPIVTGEASLFSYSFFIPSLILYISSLGILS
jgi:hypothetical protein